MFRRDFVWIWEIERQIKQRYLILIKTPKYHRFHHKHDLNSNPVKLSKCHEKTIFKKDVRDEKTMIQRPPARND
jgi:hypothetical protein